MGKVQKKYRLGHQPLMKLDEWSNMQNDPVVCAQVAAEDRIVSPRYPTEISGNAH